MRYFFQRRPEGGRRPRRHDQAPVLLSSKDLLPIAGSSIDHQGWMDSFQSAGYVVERPLARQGGQSKTFLIRNIETQRLFVGKVIPYHSDYQFIEIELLKKLKHPHIVKLIAYWTTDDDIVMVLEYCSGGDLSTYMKQYSQPSTKWIIRWMSQLCLGLHYAHLHNVIHFDLKASNVFLDKNLCVKLGDFGVSCVADKSHPPESTEIRGTLSYMSPEMLRKCTTLTWASDCWGLGCLLHELLYEGKRAFPLPFTTEDPNGSETDNTKIGLFRRKELLHNILRLLPKLNQSRHSVEDAPHHVDSLTCLLESLLQKLPEERPTLVQVLQLLYTAEFGKMPPGNENAQVYPKFAKYIKLLTQKE